jgi:hypothetical protein
MLTLMVVHDSRSSLTLTAVHDSRFKFHDGNDDGQDANYNWYVEHFGCVVKKIGYYKYRQI